MANDVSEMNVKRNVVNKTSARRQAADKSYMLSLVIFSVGFLNFMLAQICVEAVFQSEVLDLIIKSFVMGASTFLAVGYLCYAFVDKKWAHYSYLKLIIFSFANFLIGCGFLGYGFSIYLCWMKATI